MKEELDKKLCEDFPELYQDRYGDATKTCMCWGFDCREGWEPIIRKLSEQLTFLAKAEESPVKVSQVKEKYGTLRFYVQGATDIMYACISVAEHKSAYTCEYCGETGKEREDGWIKTLCPTCATKMGREIEDWEKQYVKATE